MVLNHTEVLNLSVLDVLANAFTNSWVLDCSDILNPDGFALVEILVVCADEHLLLTAYEDLLVVGFEAVLRVFRKEVTLLQLD